LTAVDIHSLGDIATGSQEIELPSSGRGLQSHLPAKVSIHFQAASSQPIGRIDARIIRSDSTLCATVDSSRATNAAELSELAGTGIIEFTLDPLQLTAGQYHITIQVTDPSDGMVIASTQSPPFDVHSQAGGADRGIYAPQVSWMKHKSDN
jgi:hypothetical protein